MAAPDAAITDQNTCYMTHQHTETVYLTFKCKTYTVKTYLMYKIGETLVKI